MTEKHRENGKGTGDINSFDNSAMVVTYNAAGLKNDMFNDTETRGGPSRQTRTDVVILFGPLRKHHGVNRKKCTNLSKRYAVHA